MPSHALYERWIMAALSGLERVTAAWKGFQWQILGENSDSASRMAFDRMLSDDEAATAINQHSW